MVSAIKSLQGYRKLKRLLWTLFVIITVVWIFACFLQWRAIDRFDKEQRYNTKIIITLIHDYLKDNFYASDMIKSGWYEQNDIRLDHLIRLNPAERYAYCKKYDIQLMQFTLQKERVFAYPDSLYFPFDLYGAIDKHDRMVIFQPSDKPGLMYFIKTSQDGFFVLKESKKMMNEQLDPILFSVTFNKLEGHLRSLSNQYNINNQIDYIVIQDTMGILAATKNIRQLSRITGEPFLSHVFHQESIQTRIHRVNGYSVMETVMPFSISEDQKALIRLGINNERYEEYRFSGLLLIVFFTLIYWLSLFLGIKIRQSQLFLLKKEYEVQTLHRMAEIGNLGAEVAHEIKNPLNAISMIVQQIDTVLGAVHNKEFFNMTYNEINRINDIIEKFLSYSKPLILDKEIFSVSDLLNYISSLFFAELTNKNITLITHIPVDIKIFADRKTLTQVMINLMKNAIESFSDETTDKKIEMSASLRKNEIDLHISDTGQGIKPELLEKIWDLYMTTKPRGNGIGLSVSQKIIRAHEGEITVESTLNKGTSFCVSLPYFKSDFKRG